MIHTLVALGNGNSINLELGKSTSVGRGEILGLNDRLISRNHFSIFISQDHKSIKLSHHGMNPIAISRRGNSEFLNSEESKELEIGDVIYLIPPNKFPYILTRPKIQKKIETSFTSSENKENLLSSGSPTRNPPILLDSNNRKRPLSIIDLTDDSLVESSPAGKSRKMAISPFPNPPLNLKREITDKKKNSSFISTPTSPIEFIDLNDTLPMSQSPGFSPFFPSGSQKRQKTLDSFSSFTSTPMISKAPIKENTKKMFADDSHSTFFLNKIDYKSKSHPQDEGAIQLQDLFEHQDYELVILTTYSLDLKWLAQTLPILRKVHNLTIVHNEEHLKKVDIELFPMAKIFLPELNIPYGVHHGKLCILIPKESEKIRVIVSTANLVYKDYNRKTNGIWFQDFPRKKAGSTDCSDFENTLYDYLQKVSSECKQIRDFDFSIAEVVLISSIPGYHNGANLEKYGHLKLRKVLSQERFPSKFQKSDVVCQFSSIGSLSESWIEEEFKKSVFQNEWESKDSTMKLVWPSVEFVRNCIDGLKAGGSLCCPDKNMKKFMPRHFHQYIPNQTERKLVPPHIKTFARVSGNSAAWMCLTSANFSTAAWGQLQKKGEQLMIRNYEIGVLFLPSKLKKELVIDSQPKTTPTQIFYPLPYTYPPPPFKDEKIWTWAYLKNK